MNIYVYTHVYIYTLFAVVTLPAAGAKGQHTLIRGQKPQNANWIIDTVIILLF